MNRFILWCTMVIMALASCSGPASPGGSEITNGKVVALGGAPAAGIPVTAYPLSYIEGKGNDSSVISTETGNDGTFLLPIDSSSYNVFIMDSAAFRGRLLPDIGPGENIGTVTLDSLGSMRVTLHRADALKRVPLFAYCKGTPLRQNLPLQDSTVVFSGIPSGAYRLFCEVEPITGCTPGIDCMPGSVFPGEAIEINVSSSETTMVDTVVGIAK